MTIGGMLQQVCTIQRNSATSDGMGNVDDVWANHLANIACSFQPMRAQERDALGVNLQDETYWCYVEGSHDINHDDRVVFNSTNYRIVGVYRWQIGTDYKKIALQRLS